MALLLLAACQERTFMDDTSDNDTRVSLGISTATASLTKAMLPPGVQTTEGMAIGLFATGSNYYTDASSTNHTATFTYSSSGGGWRTENNIFLTAEIATIYGYYPTTATFTADAIAPKLNVSVLETDAIPTPLPANASGEWRAAAAGGETDVNGANITAGTSGWFKKASDAPSLYAFAAAAAEVDYLAFIPSIGKGRLTNNGKANGGVVTADNLGTNPGSTIANLTLEHGMAMVSFRMYNDGQYKGKANWTTLVLQNASGKQVLSKGTTPQMNLTDASIAPSAFQAATFTRTIPTDTYKAPILAASGTASATVVTTAAEAQAAAVKVSCLVLPVTTAFNAGDMQVVVTVDGVVYPATPIPATPPANQWERGKNYIYTLKLSGKGLSIASVAVDGWKDVEDGEIPVN